MLNEKDMIKSISPINNIPILSEGQIDEQTEKIIEFLKVIYPFLLEDDRTWADGDVELRPIQRAGQNIFIRSYNAWRMSERDIEILKDFLNKINGKPFCLYYSAFCFDYNKEVFDSKTNRLKQKGRINRENALYTTILAADFDHMDFNEFNLEKKKLIEAGLDTLDVFTGHGFQTIILLNKKNYDKDILKKFNLLMLKKGFKADPKIIDPARILRLPFTYNCKACNEKSSYYDPADLKIMPTKVINWTKNRYSIDEVFEKLNNLPDNNNLSSSDNNIKNDIVNKGNKVKHNPIIRSYDNFKIENVRSSYFELIDTNVLPDPIKKMLAGTDEGMRNSVLMFLIPFFRNSLGLNIKTIKKIMCIWGEHCNPSFSEEFINDEVDRIYNYGFKGKHGAFTSELKKHYGYLEFDKYKRDNKVIIPNEFFEKYNEYSDCAVKIYLTMKLVSKTKEIKECTKKTLSQFLNINEKTFSRNVKFLVNLDYVCKKRANRRCGKEYIYYLNPYFKVTEGYTSLENATIRLLIDGLTDGEIKLYTYMCYMIGNKYGHDCWASQKYLASKIGKKGHSAICKMTNSMQEKHYISKVTHEKDGILHCTYNLNY